MALITTIHGDIDEDQTVKYEGGHENENEIVMWQEWRVGDELVKRNVQVQLKKLPEATAEAATLGSQG